MELDENMPAKRPKEFWSEKKAGWYLAGQRLSNFSETVMNIIRPRLAGCLSALDIGAGIGSLSIPLARELRTVAAMEPSGSMMTILKDEAAREGLHNITFIESPWGEADIPPADFVVSANVPGLYNEAFLHQVTAFARKRVALIISAGPEQDKFYYKELYPLLLGREFPPRSDYLDIYACLHRMKIYADVNVIQYDFDQPFSTIAEAVEFWKEYIPLTDNSHDALLADYLGKRLDAWEGGLLARFSKRSAVITWNTR